jgi:hypothetical protein
MEALQAVTVCTFGLLAFGSSLTIELDCGGINAIVVSFPKG